MIYHSHEDLIHKICEELGHEGEATRLIEKYLDKNVKIKMKKDKNAPKRTRSAYVLFGNAKREEIKKTNPDASNTDVMKIISEHWNKLTDEEKKVYESQSAEDKERYLEEKEEYDNGLASYVGKTNK